MDGFFSLEEIRKASGDFFEQKSKEDKCGECGLHKFVRTPRMPYWGKGKRGILIVAEAPGADEDREGRQLIGEVGQFLAAKLKMQGIDIHEDCWKINSVNCRPMDEKGANRKPTNNEIDFCRPRVLSVIEELKPKAILIMGGCACRSFFGGHFKELKIERWRGLKIPSKKHNAWLMPLYHPGHPNRNPDNDILQAYYDLDLRSAIGHIDVPFPKLPSEDEEEMFCKRVKDYDHVIEILDSIISSPPDILFYDYETTGLKPYRPGHKIVTISMSCLSDNPSASRTLPMSWAFPFQYRQPLHCNLLWHLSGCLQLCTCV